VVIRLDFSSDILEIIPEELPFNRDLFEHSLGASTKKTFIRVVPFSTAELYGTRCARRIRNFLLEVYMNAAIMIWGGGKRRSWEKEPLLKGATAGTATAIGAAMGGKKGAVFGAFWGGATRFLMGLLSWKTRHVVMDRRSEEK